MANASVEKLKALGLRHGEKAVMALAATLCVLFLGMAANKPTIQTTPEEVRKAAEAADANLKRRQNTEDILRLLEENNIKNPNFQAMVDNQEKNKLDPLAYQIKGPWASPEPGAGLIRDTPRIIAPTELVAFPGRGGALVYELKDGERIKIDPNEAAPVENSERRKRANRRAAYMAVSSYTGDAMGAGGAPKSAAQLAQEKKEYEAKVARLKKILSGKDVQKKEEGPDPLAPEGPFKETVKGLRWVVITGVLDYQKMREDFEAALKRKEVAYPHFKQLDLERQERNSDGSWSEWTQVDYDKNQEVLNNLPEVDEEWATQTALMSALVDPLPFLRAGYWEKVHVASLVPKEKKEIAKPTDNFMGGMMGSRYGMMMGGMGDAPDMGSMMMERMGPGSGMYGEAMGGYGGGGTDDMNFEKNDEPTLMVRALDFTVDPDKSYRYRVRIVVFNPNRGREDIAPGVDKEAIELKGEWSEATDEVVVPPDVAAYTMAKAPNVGTREQVKFEVDRWDPKDGVMVVKQFDAGPGEVLGDYRSADIPTSDGSDKQTRKVDFNTHEVVLDAIGGTKPVPPSLDRGQFEVPAVSLLVRPDGSVAIRSQAVDVSNEVRKSTAENYQRELKESGKKRESAQYGYGSEGP